MRPITVERLSDEALADLQAAITTETIRRQTRAGTRPWDPELDLLNRLNQEFPEACAAFIAKHPVPEAYANHPDTICSAGTPPATIGSAGTPPTQSRLGFLNQSRRARGLPIIVIRLDRKAPPEAWKCLGFSSGPK